MPLLMPILVPILTPVLMPILSHGLMPILLHVLMPILMPVLMPILLPLLILSGNIRNKMKLLRGHKIVHCLLTLTNTAYKSGNLLL